MLRYSRMLWALALGFAGVGGCSSPAKDDPPAGEAVGVAELSLESNGIRADNLKTAAWGDNIGFNTSFDVTNTGTQATTNWQVDLQLPQANITAGPWNAILSGQTGTTFTLRSDANNSVLQPGAKANIYFNGAWYATPHTNPSIVAVRRNVGTGSGGTSSSGGSTGMGGTPSGGATGKAGSGNGGAAVVPCGGNGGSGGTSGNNVALDKPATASSVLAGTLPSYGNDASTVTTWCASSGAVNEWWQTDLGGNYALTGTEVTWPFAGRIYQYAIAISSDGINFTEVVNQRGNTRTSQIQADNFVAQGRYVRLTVTGFPTTPATLACLSNFKAFGAQMPTGGGGTPGVLVGGTTGNPDGGTNNSGGSIAAGGKFASGGTLGSGGAAGSGGVSAGGVVMSGGSSGEEIDRRIFTIRLPGGVRRQDAAVAVDGGKLSLMDRTQVVHDDGTYSSVTGMAMPDGSRIGVEAHVKNVWVDGSIQLANRTVVDGFAKATGNISREPDTIVNPANVFQGYQFTTPEVIRWDVDFPLSPATSANLAVGQSFPLTPGNYDLGYVPSNAHLKLTAGVYTFNRMTVEDQGVIEIDNSLGAVFVYLRDYFAFRGRIDRALAKANVLFGVAGTEPVSVEREFKGILVVPNAEVTLTSTVEHRGAFFGKAVTVLQQSRLVHEPFDPVNFCDSNSACTDFCPCGGDTCGESTCATGKTCGKDFGPRFHRAKGTSLCVDPSCVAGTGLCGNITDLCGLCRTETTLCSADSDCQPGEVCGALNGGRLGRDPHLDVCWPAICTSAPNTPPNCGTKDSACGKCDCSAACSAKTCGDDNSDGCGGICTGFCPTGLAGCKRDSDCAAGSVCGYHIGPRFGFAADANVCWPSTCRMQDPAKPNGGVDVITCGVSPACVPSCEAGFTGPDGCGGFCGQCNSGEIRTPFGYCSQIILNIWQSPWTAPATASFTSGAQDGLAVAMDVATPSGPSSGASPGAIEATFAVSDLGEAEYTIPIVVPPGRQGMEPSISLSYRSNKVNGMMGFGWAIGGLSTISRCPQTFARDGQARGVKFDNDDRFCLDGKALILVEETALGARYRLEGDPTLRIEATRSTSSPEKGPASFTIRTKDGRVQFYGSVDGGSATISTATGVRRVWALSIILDRSGNSISIAYRKQMLVGEQLNTIGGGGGIPAEVDVIGELLPDAISYGRLSSTKADSRFVHFNYEERPDPVLHYMWGTPGYSKLRLSSVETFVSEQPVRKYKIAYRTDRAGDTSLVGSITECSSLGGDEVCKAPTTFDYLAGGGWDSPVDMFTQDVEKDVGRRDGVTLKDYIEYQTLILDVDGDGRDDVLRVSKHAVGDTPDYHAGDGNEGSKYRCDLWVSRLGTGTPSIHKHVEGDSTLNIINACTELVLVSQGEKQVRDSNRDGKDDVIAYYSLPSGLLSTGNVSGSLTQLFRGHLGDVRLSGVVQHALAQVDLDGNGFSDAIACSRDVMYPEDHDPILATTVLYDGIQWTTTTRSKETDQWGGYGLDWNGDGKEEWTDSNDLHLDFNADGLPDNQWNWEKFAVPGLNTGAFDKFTFGAFPQWVPGVLPGHATGVDADGDSRQEVVSTTGSVAWSGAAQQFIFDTTKKTPFRPISKFKKGSTSWDAWGVIRTGDFDGDGSLDLLDTGVPEDAQYWSDPPLPHTTVRYSLSHGTARTGLLREIRDGLGKRTTIEYRQYHEASYVPVYSPGSCFSEPLLKTSKCLKKVGPVVSSHTEDQISGFTYNSGPRYKYSYSNARRGVGGRNWMVFKNRTIEGPLSKTEIEYYTDTASTSSDPFGAENRFLVVGKPKSIVTSTTLAQPASAFSQAVGTLVQTQNSSYTLDPTKTFAYLSSQEEATAEDGAAVVTTNRKVHEIDPFGFVRYEETTTSAAAQTEKVVISRGVTNNAPQWRIGQLDSEIVTSTIGGKTQTRTTKYGHDSMGRLESIEREPSGAPSPGGGTDASNPYLKTTLTRDAYGNVNSITVADAPNGGNSRELWTATQWTDDYFWPRQTVDALGHSLTMTTLAATGQLASSTDDNAAVSWFTYDPFGRPTYADTPTGIYSTTYGPGLGQFTAELIPIWSAFSVRTQSQSGEYQQTEYDAYGRVVQTARSGFGAEIHAEFEFDQAGRLVREARPHAASSYGPDKREGFVVYEYYGSRLGRATLPDGNVVQYDHFSRSSAIHSAATWVAVAGAAFGLAEVHPRGNVSATVLDPSGRPLLRATGGIDSDSSVVTYTYCPFGAPSSIVGPGGATVIENDALGRPTSVTESSTGTTQTIYNGFGEPVRQTNANNVTTHYDYDQIGRPIKIRSSADEVIAQWIYDGPNPNEKGRLVASYRQSRPGTNIGTWQRYGYQSQTYGGLFRGMLTSITYGINGTDDEPESGEQVSIGYKYEQPGAPWRVSGITYPTAAGENFGVGLQYSTSGQLAAVTMATSPSEKYWELLATDQGMRPAVERFGNGVQTSYGYYHVNNDGTPACDVQGGTGSCMPGWLAAMSVQVGSNPSTPPLLQQYYEYDGNHNLLKKTERGAIPVKHTFDYDAQERLLTHVRVQTDPINPSTTVDQFTYDTAGNLTSKTGAGTYQYNAVKPFQLDAAGGVTYEWDSAGNLQKRNFPHSQQVIDYDNLNLPYRITNAASGGQNQAVFEYDATGARVVKRNLDNSTGTLSPISTTIDIGELYQQVRQYDPSTGSGEPIRKEHHYRVFVGSRQIAEIVKPEVNGVIVADEVTTRYLHQDHLGSSVLATDEAGNVEYRQEFDAFGSIKSGGTWNYDNANSGFTGHQHDNELQLINMRGRLYDPKIGRFTKADPFVTDPWSAAGLNRYSYVRNSPLNYVDPSGFDPENPNKDACSCFLFICSCPTPPPPTPPPPPSNTGGGSSGGSTGKSGGSSSGKAATPPQPPQVYSASLAPPKDDLQGVAAASPQGGGFRNSDMVTGGPAYAPSAVDRNVALLRGLTNGTPMQQTLNQQRLFYSSAVVGTIVVGTTIVGTAMTIGGLAEGAGAAATLLTELGIDQAAFTSGSMVAFEQPGLVGFAQMQGSRLVAGIFSINAPGQGVAMLSQFRAQAFLLGRALGATEVELVGAEFTNATLRAMLVRQGFVAGTMEAPAAFGGGVMNVLSKVIGL